MISFDMIWFEIYFCVVKSNSLPHNSFFRTCWSEEFKAPQQLRAKWSDPLLSRATIIETLHLLRIYNRQCVHKFMQCFKTISDPILQKFRFWPSFFGLSWTKRGHIHSPLPMSLIKNTKQSLFRFCTFCTYFWGYYLNIKIFLTYDITSNVEQTDKLTSYSYWTTTTTTEAGKKN